MTTPRTGFARGLAWNLGSSVLPLLGSFVVSLLIAPYLGPERFGRYVTVMAAATMALIVGKFGVHAATSRLLSENEGQSGLWLRAGLTARSLFTLPVAALVLVASPVLARWFGGGSEETGAFWLTAAVVVSASYYELGMEALVGLRRFPQLFATRLAFLILRLIAVAWVRLAALGTVTFVSGHALAQAIPALVLLAGLLGRHRGEARGDSSRPALRTTLRIALPLAVSSASFLVYAQTDKLMLAWMRGTAEVGQFGVARNILDASLFPAFALAWSLRPDLVRAVAGRGGSPRATLAQGLRFSTVFAVGAPALLLIFGGPLLISLYTDAYREAASLLIWMLPILFLRGIGIVIFPALLAADDQAAYARLMAWTAAVNLVANLVLIPPLGARGAVIATGLALLPLTAGGLLQVRRRFGCLPWGDARATHLRAGAGGMGLVLWAAVGPAPPEGLLGLVFWALAATLGYAVVSLAGTGRPASDREA